MKINRKTFFVLAAVSINLVFSTGLSLADSVSGTIGITNCTVDCFSLSALTSLSLNGTQFIDNNSKNFYLYSFYDLGNKVSIKNALENTGFELSVISSKLTNTSDPSIQIPYSQIGILSFNDSPTQSIDASRINTDTPIESNIDPVVIGQTSEPFDQSALKAHIDNQDNIENYYTYFSGTGVNSDPIDIVSGPNDDNSMGYFNFGISTIVKLPDRSISDLGVRAGQYNLTLTFSLIST